MQNSKYKSLWESHKHNKTFSDALVVSLDRLHKENLLSNTHGGEYLHGNTIDNEISSQSTRLGDKIYKAIMNVRKCFLMKKKLKELDVKLKENEEEQMSNTIHDESIMCIDDHQQVSETLEKSSAKENEEEQMSNTIHDESVMCIDDQQVSGTLEKTSATQISESEAVIIEMIDDHTSNNLTYSNENKDSAMDEEEPCKDNHNNDNNKLNNNSSAVNLPEPKTQQSITDGVKRKLMEHDSSLPTKPNKRPRAVEDSQKPGSRCGSANETDKINEKTNFADCNSDGQNDSHQRQSSKSENAGEPTTLLQINNTTNDSEMQEFYKKLRDILSKLIRKSIDETVRQVKSLKINSQEKLQGVVDLIFDKAIDEPNSAYTYATMCKKLSGIRSHVVDIHHENKADFRALFLARCEHVFESTAVNEVERNAKLQEIEECIGIKKKKKLIALLKDADRRVCKKAVGNIRLIGELFNQNLIRINRIDGCIQRLSAATVDYSIECLCKLLIIIGAKLESSKNNNFDDYFFRMTLLATDKKLSLKVRRMVQDVIDLRAQNWKPTRDQGSRALMSQSNNNDTHQYHTHEAKNAREATTCLQMSNMTDYSHVFYKKTRDILNKLTPENVFVSAQQIISLDIDSREKLQGVVDSIFDKAIDEPSFVTVYAMMCNKLFEMKIIVVDMRQENIIDFATLLVARCEHEFENVSVIEAARRYKLNVLLNDPDRRLCRKAVGNIRLIGELFKQNMIRLFAIDGCIKHLLAIPVDYNIECLCELFKTIGATLENSEIIDFNGYFLEMTELVKGDRKLSSRVRHKVRDVIDLRARNWKLTKDKGNPVSMNHFNNNDTHQYQTKNAGEATTSLQTSNIIDDSQAFYKTILDILNELTRKNVFKSAQRIKSLGINSYQKLQGVVDLVFEKAVYEPNFAAIYATMCEKLRNERVVYDDIKQNDSEKQGKLRTKFQTLLSKRCEHEFESAIATRCDQLKEINKFNEVEKTNEITALLSDAEYRLYMESVAYFKFIGELFKRRILQEVFLKKCVNYLLKIPNEKYIECLCELLKTIGETLDSKDSNLNRYLSEMTCNEQLSPRVRHMLQDITDLNAQKWKPRRDKDKTINQVSEESTPSKKNYKTIEGNDSNVPTEINKQSDVIATLTPTETNQQTSIQSPGSSNTDATNDKILDIHRHPSQTPAPETPEIGQNQSMPLSSEGQARSSSTNAPINYRSNDETLDMHSDLPRSPEPETKAMSQSTTSPLYVIYSHLDEQIKFLVNVAIDQFNDKIDNLDYPEFIRRSLEVTMLESLNVCEKYWTMVAQMITNNIFPLSVFQSEFDQMFEEIERISPTFWTIRAEILKTLVICGAHKLKELKRTTSVLKTRGLVGKLVGELLRLLASSEGPSAVIDKWNDSGIEWSDLLDTSLEDPDDIVEKYNLQFLTFGKTDPLNGQLLKLLRASDFDNIKNWITTIVGEENSRTPKFIRILFTLLLESGIETLEHSKSSFNKRNFFQPNRSKIINLLPLMKDYIRNNLKSELQCLYALTDVNHRCRNPPGFAYDVIKGLREKDIISIGAFYVWNNGTAVTSESIGHDEAVWNLLSQSFWIEFQNPHW